MSKRSEPEFYERMNKVMEKLSKTDLSKYESKYCWTLFRNTYGYGEYEVKILGRKIAEKTGILEENIYRTEKRLKSRNIIKINGKIKGFNWNTEEWENLSTAIGFQNLSTAIGKPIYSDRKNLSTAIGPLSTKERKLNKGGVGLEKLGIKEVDKLEGKKWLKQVMWQRGGFRERFIDEIFNIYSFMQCYDTYLAYQDAHSVRDKEAWVLAKLRRGPETEE